MAAGTTKNSIIPDCRLPLFPSSRAWPRDLEYARGQETGRVAKIGETIGPYAVSAGQARWLEKKVEHEKIVLASLPQLSRQHVEFAREHGRVTIGTVIKLTGPRHNRLKQHVRTLVERSTLNQHGRGVWYKLR